MVNDVALSTPRSGNTRSARATEVSSSYIVAYIIVA